MLNFSRKTLTIIYLVNYIRVFFKMCKACVIKALEEEWGERYLATFPATRTPQPRKEKVLRNDLLQLAGNGGKMPNKWRVFYVKLPKITHKKTELKVFRSFT